MRCPDLHDLPLPGPGQTGWPFTHASDRAADQGLPRISIVIPSLNQGRYLEEALRSVLLQGYPDLEVIVMDGGSTDQTVAVLRKYDPWIRWVSGPDRGQSNAINEGFRRATGEIFAWIGCDDRLLPGVLTRVGAHFTGRPDTAWFAGAGRLIFATGRTGEMASRIAGPDDLPRYWLWANGCYVVQPSCFWRRRLWDAAGGVREELHLAMDYDLWLRFADHATLFSVDEVLSVALREAGGKTFEQPRRQRAEMMRCAYEQRARHGAGAWALNAALLRWYVAERLRSSAGHLLRLHLAAGLVDIARAAAAPVLVTCGRGRLAMIMH